MRTEALVFDFERMVVNAAIVALVAINAMSAGGVAFADISIIRLDPDSGGGLAQVANGAVEKDLDRWRTGGLDGWGGCIFLKMDPRTDEEICGCLGRQLSAVGPYGVELALENVQACPSLFIQGAWNSNWGQTLAKRAPVSFKYEASSRKITGCWAEPAGNGKITGFIRDGVFSARSKSFSFNYDDDLLHTTGKAALTLSNTAQALTLLGSWSSPGASGQWTMVRDPIRRPLACDFEPGAK